MFAAWVLLALAVLATVVKIAPTLTATAPRRRAREIFETSRKTTEETTT